MSDRPVRELAPEQLRLHKAAVAPTVTRLDPAKLVELANTRLNIQFRPIFSTNLQLSARHPYDATLGHIDVYMPARWDTGQDSIYMDAIVQGAQVGEWTGSVLYGQFNPTRSGQHLIAIHFTGVNITAHLSGPWGVTTAETATVHDAGVVLAFATVEAGQSTFFELNFTAPSNLADLGYVSLVQAFN